MPGGVIMASADANMAEAPITIKAYLMCAFAAFGGIFFGFDSGYINGVLDTNYAIHTYTHKPYPPTGNSPADLAAQKQSLIVSILSAGTFFGALIAGDVADFIGRRVTIIVGCIIFVIGVILQVASTTVPLLVVGRVVAGIGVGFVSAIIILYMSEIAPKRVRGSIVAGYQLCITLGIFLASCVTYATEHRTDSGSYRIPMGIQLLWGLILGVGLCFLPESPRYFVKRGRIDKATAALVSLRSQPADSHYVQNELAEIIANHEYEMSLIPPGNWFKSWAHCFTGSVFNPGSNLRRTILGTALQMFQQWTGVNFIFYFGTQFFSDLITDPFAIQITANTVNVIGTPPALWAIERFGRRQLLFWGAVGMVVCLFIAAALGVSHADKVGHPHPYAAAEVAFICIFIFFFASTWGPCAWVVVGEIFPLPIRSRGVALSTASNWMWNTIIATINPYLVGTDKANLQSKIFLIFGCTCIGCAVFTYFCVPETKGLSLEQVDRMFEESTPRTSSKWKPHSTFAADVGMVDGKLNTEVVDDVERKGSTY
ncbi:hypothetical protein ANO11243_017970 [Dothideomycetidae sp. 11243]|nr:hypothetical protein ANO11243_017970 [fungal sp. No.11243]